MAEKRLELVPDAFVRTYVGETGWSWIVVRRQGGGRVQLSLTDRVLVDLADGSRSLAKLRRDAELTLGHRLAPRELEGRLEELVSRGVLRDGAGGFSDLDPVWPANLIRMRLDDDTVPKLVLSEGARVGCDGRGGCCRLYDRIDVNVVDIANLKRAFPDDALTPGGLSIDSALRRDRDGSETFSIASCDGACVALEKDGRCGVHARLGIASKPAGCRTFPLRDVLVGDELHVGLATECRCVFDFAASGDPIDQAAHAILARRLETRAVETVAGRVAMSCRDLGSREAYLEWREAATSRAATATDLSKWALDEAALLVGADRAASGVWSSLRRVLGRIERLFEEEARDTAAVYASIDLQPKAFAWGAQAAALLGALIDDEHQLNGPPDSLRSGERFLVEQALFTHGLLRARSLSTGLVSLAVRIALARAGADLPLPPELAPLSTVEYLFRAHAGGFLVDRQGEWIDAALA